eukprot:481645-Rhodomonas_salina.1
MQWRLQRTGLVARADCPAAIQLLKCTRGEDGEDEGVDGKGSIGDRGHGDLVGLGDDTLRWLL